MKRVRMFAIVIASLLATGIFAQSGQPSHGIPTAKEQMKLLNKKLNLTSDQRAKVKTILQEMNDATQKLMQDETMSSEERLHNARLGREKADKKIRDILSDDQKKKLDQLEREPHPELHGDVHGAR